MRMTAATMCVARALLDDPEGKHYGYELSRACELRSGVLYPILRRLHHNGLLADGWEDPQAISGRPPRRYYTLTDTGRTHLATYVDRAAT